MEKINRKYNMTDIDLESFVSKFYSTLENDITELSPFGIDNVKIQNLINLYDNFKFFPVDSFYKYDLLIEIENKNKVRKQLEKTLLSMSLRVDSKWGKNSTNYNRLGASNPVILSDDSLLVKARDAHSLMITYVSDLSEYGLTQQVLDDFENLNDEYENALKNVADKYKLRLDKTRERIELGNELYKLVSMYCEIGKKVFAGTNRYKYYVMYDKKKVKEEE